jgi:hypothetical protein
MQVGLLGLTFWSFLMASAHGAGFMLLPVVMGTLPGHSHHEMHVPSYGPWTGTLAVTLHTLGYLLTTGTIAVVAYEWLGLSLLRKAWINLDLIWAVALMVTAGAALLV